MKNIQNNIRKELENLREEKYKKFIEKLIPGCSNILGVRIPKIKNIANNISNEIAIEYLKTENEIYFEEKMLKGIIIGKMKDDIGNILKQTQIFIPKIDNWSICDTFCNGLKIFRNHRKLVWDFLEKYWKSDKVYEIRFAIVIMIFHFMERDYLQKMFFVFDNAEKDSYYASMSVAWAISICFIKFEKETMDYLKQNKLDNKTYNKALQKIVESLKIDKETKEIIRQMKK